MEFNRNKPFGEVFGDPRVRYVQNGIEYNAQGKPVDLRPVSITGLGSVDTKVDKPPQEVPVAVNDVESAKAFLSNVLSNGPIAKSVIFAEAERNNQNWSVVKDAMTAMGVKVVSIGPKKQEYWQFNKE